MHEIYESLLSVDGQVQLVVWAQYGQMHSPWWWRNCAPLPLNVLAERHGTTVTTLRSLKPTITARPSDQLPLGSWLFLPKRRAAANADTSTTSLPAGFYIPETLAAYLGVSLARGCALQPLRPPDRVDP